MTSRSNTETTVFALGGYNPLAIVTVSEGWSPRIFVTDLTPHLSEGLSAISYLLVPAAPRGGCSSRFDPDNPFFQTFFGVYVIAQDNLQPPDVEIFAEIGNRDNRAWLRRMGDPRPFSTTSGLPAYETMFDGRVRVRADVHVHADIGPGNPAEGMPPELTVPPGLWRHALKGYEDRLDTLHAVAWWHERYLVVTWYTGARLTDRRGQSLDTHARYPWIRSGQEAMIRSVRIIDDGRGPVFSREKDQR